MREGSCARLGKVWTATENPWNPSTFVSDFWTTSVICGFEFWKMRHDFSKFQVKTTQIDLLVISHHISPRGFQPRCGALCFKLKQFDPASGSICCLAGSQSNQAPVDVSVEKTCRFWIVLVRKNFERHVDFRCMLSLSIAGLKPASLGQFDSWCQDSRTTSLLNPHTLLIQAADLLWLNSETSRNASPIVGTIIDVSNWWCWYVLFTFKFMFHPLKRMSLEL